MSEQPDLIDLLTERQRSLGETDREFAWRIGMSRSLWQVLRTRGARAGVRTLAGVTAAFPNDEDIAAAVRSFLVSANANTLTSQANEMAIEVSA